MVQKNDIISCKETIKLHNGSQLVEGTKCLVTENTSVEDVIEIKPLTGTLLGESIIVRFDSRFVVVAKNAKTKFTKGTKLLLVADGTKLTFHEYFAPIKNWNGSMVDCICISDNGIIYALDSRLLIPQKENKHKNKVNGPIALEVHGNTVRIEDNGVHVVGTAKCHPHDTFNITNGIALAAARAYRDKELEEFILNRTKE